MSTIKQMMSYLGKMKSYVQANYQDDVRKEHFYLFIGDVFPTELDFRKQNIESEMNLKFATMRWADIMKKLPKYKM